MIRVFDSGLLILCALYFLNFAFSTLFFICIWWSFLWVFVVFGIHWCSEMGCVSLVCLTNLFYWSDLIFLFSWELVLLIYFPANFCGLLLLLLIDVVQKWVVFCWFFARNCLWSLLWFFFVYPKVLVCLLRKWRKIESNENLKCQIFHYFS